MNQQILRKKRKPIKNYCVPRYRKMALKKILVARLCKGHVLLSQIQTMFQI